MNACWTRPWLTGGSDEVAATVDVDGLVDVAIAADVVDVVVDVVGLVVDVVVDVVDVDVVVEVVVLDVVVLVDVDVLEVVVLVVATLRPTTAEMPL